MEQRGIIRHPLALAAYLVGVFILAFLVMRRCDADSDDTIARTQIAMGTLVEIQIQGMSEQEAHKAMDAVFAEVRRIDTLFSTYLAEGPVWKLNHAGDTVAVLPEEIHVLMRHCDTLWRDSGGAFDVAVEPLVQAWGFGGDAPGIPESAMLEAARSASGWKHVTLLDGNRVSMCCGVRINFGAIAKGYAVDRAVAVLASLGVRRGLVNAGGEVRSAGGTWTVGIQHPRDEHSLLAAIDLRGRAIATSGDYEQYFEHEGVRYHHIFDPATGMPAYGCQSVSILADDDMTADALATAVFVMGPAEGMTFLQQHGIDGMIVDDRGSVKTTPGFEKHILR